MTEMQAPQRVLAYSVRPDAPRHEVETNRALARWLAAARGLEYGGDYSPEMHQQQAAYLVPTQTIVGDRALQALGLQGPDDLFGGFVEHSYIGTKAIVHPLVADAATVPPGWSSRFGEQVRNAVLKGNTVFSTADAKRAVAALAEGPLRIKPIHACGGRGQIIIADVKQFEALLAEPEMAQLFDAGVVVEEDLQHVDTYSVGQISVGGLLLSYHGSQCLTVEAGGQQVYGGSTLWVVRGGYEQLLARELTSETRQAVEHAQLFDAAANACYPRFFASRRNYDIARGVDRRGEIRCGVLEQSWRMGGASSAEIAALQAFVDDPALQSVRASSVEVYRDEAIPEGAVEVFRGSDAEVGFILKYTVIGTDD